MVGVSSVAIFKKIKNKTLIVNAAGFLDTDNPVNAAYLSKHRRKADEAAVAEQIRASAGAGGGSFTGETFSGNGPPRNAARPDDFALLAVSGLPAREMLNMTLRELVTKYPGIDKIERYAKILKDTTMSAEREQRMQERALTTIPKDFVVSRLFAFIDGLVIKIIEYPDSVVDRIIEVARVESETTRIDVIEILTTGLSNAVGNPKDNIVSELNSLKSKYQKDIQAHDSQLDDLKEAIEEARNG